jgi:hypothetical protein
MPSVYAAGAVLRGGAVGVDVGADAGQSVEAVESGGEDRLDP